MFKLINLFLLQRYTIPFINLISFANKLLGNNIFRLKNGIYSSETQQNE